MRPAPKLLLTATATMAAGGAVAGIGSALVLRKLWRKLRDTDFNGKVVVITGASRGLGLAIAHAFAAEGARLAICARDAGELDWAEQELRSRGADVFSWPCDVGNQEEVRRFIAAVQERYGGIDVLVNNAGVIGVGPIRAQTVADFELAMRVMFWGMLYPTLEVLPQMLERRAGWIANVTSVGGKVSIPRLLPYGVAKFAAVGFSEGLRAELARYGVKVTTIVPGLMRTGGHINANFKGDHRKEFGWFSVGASTPATAMSAHRAARAIVRAIKTGRAELTLTWQAKLLARANGIAPGLVSDLLGIVNRILPGADSTDTRVFRGKESRSTVSESPVTLLGRRAGAELHQFPERRASGEGAADRG